MNKRHFLAAAVGLLLAGNALAQDANGPIKIVVPFAAGGRHGRRGKAHRTEAGQGAGPGRDCREQAWRERGNSGRRS